MIQSHSPDWIKQSELEPESCCKLFCYTSKMDANPKHGKSYCLLLARWLVHLVPWFVGSVSHIYGHVFANLVLIINLSINWQKHNKPSTTIPWNYIWFGSYLRIKLSLIFFFKLHCLFESPTWNATFRKFPDFFFFYLISGICSVEKNGESTHFQEIFEHFRIFWPKYNWHLCLTQ